MYALDLCVGDPIALCDSEQQNRRRRRATQCARVQIPPEDFFGTLAVGLR
jgi:hypothetical protein